MRKQDILYFTFFLGFIYLVFRNWFLMPQIVGGDWPYFFDEILKNYSFFFSSWNQFRGNGLGGVSPFYSLGVFHGFTVFLSQTFHLSWPFTYKFSWFGLFIGLSIFSSMYLLRTVLAQVKFWQQIFASMIFSTNTYILMVVSGGQMGIALSYSVAPLVLARFLILIRNISFPHKIFNFQFSIFNSLIAGLVLAIQVMFDPRIAYLTMIAVVIYLTLSIKRGTLNIFLLLLYSIVIPIGIATMLHGAWILPMLFLQSNSDPQGLTSVAGFRFFSFADLSQSISLLQPNWPENIFGKTYFMKSEFLLLSILAYSSLLFFRNKQRVILFFVLLGIIGAFLAKGVNPPFGEINTFLFENVPGMNMFRDPTKFYLLTALAYSILIPFNIYSIYKWLSAKCKVQSAKLQFKVKSYIPELFLLFTICYLLFLIRPAIFGQLGGTFKKHDVPKEYIELKDFLHNQKDFFRTLWVPRQQRFSFVSDIHPAIEAEPLFSTRSAEMLSKKISSEQGQALLSELSVKYVLIQYDSLGEQFLEDRKYSEEQRMEYERKLDAITWLRKIRSGKIAVYEVPFKKNHFFLEGIGKISVITINPMHYALTVSVNQPQNLIFSEGYSPYWILKKSQGAIFSKKTKNGLNSFWLDQKGEYRVEISFSLEKYYEYGRTISSLAIIGLTISMIKLRKKMI